jgi:hypothetical protein
MWYSKQSTKFRQLYVFPFSGEADPVMEIVSNGTNRARGFPSLHLMTETTSLPSIYSVHVLQSELIGFKK